MSFEDRVRSAADQAVGALVQQMLEQAAEQRDLAVREARAKAFEEAEQAAQARVVEAEARVRSAMEAAMEMARAEERDNTARDTRRQMEGEFAPKMAEALAQADARTRLALAAASAQAMDELKAAVAAARVKEREIEMAGVSRLLESVRGLDGATTLTEVLDALALASAREAARAAVVVLRGERINGWKIAGFGPRDAQPKSIDLPLSDSGVIGLAAGAARAVTTRDSQSAGIGPGFEKLPADRMGLAVPVIVGGRVVAVVYADAVTLDGHERAVPSGWPESIEVLARHAGRCLEALTTQRTATPRITTGTQATQGAQGPPSRPEAPPAGSRRSSLEGERAEADARPGGASSAMIQITDGVAAAARRTARLLVSEIRLFHEPAVNEGRRHRNLLARLAPEIEKARLAYNEPVPAGVHGHADYLHHEIVRALAGGDPELLGNLV